MEELRIQNEQLKTIAAEHTEDPGKVHKLIIVKKNLTAGQLQDIVDKYDTDKHDQVRRYESYKYWIGRIQQRNVKTRLQCLKEKYPRMLVLSETKDPNSVNLLNKVKEKYSCVVSYGCHVDLKDVDGDEDDEFIIDIFLNIRE